LIEFDDHISENTDASNAAFNWLFVSFIKLQLSDGPIILRNDHVIIDVASKTNIDAIAFEATSFQSYLRCGG
jgi:hypothetical protein